MNMISNPLIELYVGHPNYVAEYDEQGNLKPCIVDASGVFLIDTVLRSEFADYLYEGSSEENTKTTWSQISGVTTYCYRFETDEQARTVLGYWYPSEENEPFKAAYRKADKRRKERIEEIKTQAELLYVQDVTDSAGNTWKGGESSAMKVKSAIELTQFAGLSEITITDAKREPHVMPIADALTVAAVIGADYQRKFLARQATIRALEQIDCFAADALAQIESIKLEV